MIILIQLACEVQRLLTYRDFATVYVYVVAHYNRYGQLAIIVKLMYHEMTDARALIAALHHVSYSTMYDL